MNYLYMLAGILALATGFLLIIASDLGLILQFLGCVIILLVGLLMVESSLDQKETNDESR